MRTYVYAIAALPLLALPIAAAASQQKGSIALLVLGLSILFGSALAIKRGTMTFSATAASAYYLPLIAVAVVSSLLSQESFFAWTGSQFEWGTVGFFVLLACAAYAGSLLRPDERLVRLMIPVSIAAAGCISIAASVLGIAFHTGTLAGSAQEMVALAAAGALFAAIVADSASAQTTRLFYGCIAVLCGGVFLAYFDLVVGLALLVTSAAVLTIFLLSAPHRRLPYASTAIVCGVLIAIVVGMRAPLVPTPAVAKPSFVNSELVLVESYYAAFPRVLIGSGPLSFPATWERFRSVDQNSGELWDTTPQSAFATILTLAITLGTLGVLAYLLPGAMLLAQSVRAYSQSRSLSPAFAYTVLALFPIILSCFTTTPFVLGLIGALALGIASALYAPRRSFEASQYIAALAGAAGVLVALVLLLVAARQLVASEFHARALSIRETSPAVASGLFDAAARMWNTPERSRDAARAALQELFNTIERDKAAGKTIEPSSIRAIADAAVDRAAQAVELDIANYASWLLQGQIYMDLAPLGYAEAVEKAQNSFEQARQLAPARPDIPFVQAVLSGRQGDAEAARAFIIESLRLKPDYAEALQAKRQLEATPPPEL